MSRIPANTIERLSLYRRLLERTADLGRTDIYSYELASMACVTPAKVRRDLMNLGCIGNPSRGYSISELIGNVSVLLDSDTPREIALVGVGNLGRAILSYFRGRRKNLQISVAFDSDRRKTGRIIVGCRCLSMKELKKTITERNIAAAILAVPAKAAQETADKLVEAGIKGILNYAPVPLRLPDHVFAENRDMTTALEKVAYFAGLQE